MKGDAANFTAGTIVIADRIQNARLWLFDAPGARSLKREVGALERESLLIVLARDYDHNLDQWMLVMAQCGLIGWTRTHNLRLPPGWNDDR